MKEFTYQVKDQLGIHARPAGMLINEAKKYKSVLTIDTGAKKAELTRLMAVMALGVKCGQTVTVTAEGEDEDKAIKEIEKFFETNL
ncbi:MAG: HPr family phosphocarrier protein [Firmicutes bacterium]|nr:HPr family phosphocarrier protein [Bacillota bacterium]